MPLMLNYEYEDIENMFMTSAIPTRPILIHSNPDIYSNYTIDGAKSGTVKIADNDNPRDRDSNDLVLKVETLDEINLQIGTGLQGGSEGEVIDLRGFDGRTLNVDTIVVGDSDYRNYIGFYAVEDAQGTLASGLKVSAWLC
jgi:hypothetical protein